MSPQEHAIRRIAGDKGYFVLKMKNDIWEFSRGRNPAKTLYCQKRALDWIQNR